MVDEDKIRANSLAREGVKMLAKSGVLKDMLAEGLANLASGDANEEEESLVERIREYRRNSGVLLTLQELGEQLVEENQDDDRE